MPPDIRLDRLQHTRWTIADGAPTGARAMAQGTDGALWIGSGEGLFRFDGVQFDRINAPGKEGRPFGDVYALMSTPDGSLWIGLRNGGAYQFKDAQFTHHAETQGLPTDLPIFGFALGRDGRLFAGTRDRLFALDRGRWREVGTELGFPSGWFHHLAVDRDGGLWASTDHGVWHLLPDAKHAVQENAESTVGFLAALSDGSVWYAPILDESMKTPDLTVLRPAPGQPRTAGLRASGLSGRPLLGDHHGGLWATLSPGIVRLPRPSSVRLVHRLDAPPAQVQRFTRAQGLSGDQPEAMLEDRDGNIWISTNEGLDRFRVPALRFTPDVGPNGRLGTAADGSLLVCGGGLTAAGENGPIEPLRRVKGGCDGMTVEPSGRSWWVLGGGLWWRQGDRAGEIPWPIEAQPVLGVPAIQADREGALWVSLTRHGIFRYRQDRWTHFVPDLEALRKMSPSAIGTDRAGRVWFGYRSGEVLLLDGDRQRVWNRADGLELGRVTVLTPYEDAMLVGGAEGLALFDTSRDRVTMLQAEGGERFGGVAGIVMDGGHVWIQASRTVFRIGRDALERAAADPGVALRADRFDDADGLRGLSSPDWPWPTATRTGDGRLWFSTLAGTFILHPNDTAQTRPPPPVELRGWTIEGKDADLQTDRSLPIGTKRIELRYGAIDISQPQRVRYRYRLEGVDTDWQATSARNASYTNLPPGAYTFRVAAASGQGPWGPREATLRFSIPPAFHQTAWFYALCAAGAIFLVWVAHRLHIGRITTRIRLRAEAQAQERERIARDLHDTLLQSAHGLVLTVHAMAEHTPADHPDKARLEHVLERADQAVREGRRKVLELRATEDESDLTAWLGDVACELTERGPASITVHVEGRPRLLRAEICNEAMYIGQEAMINAQKHSGADRIVLRLQYGAAVFRLLVLDNGIGMSAKLMEGAEQPPGHFGLPGMRERAAARGARLSIHRNSAAETVVEFIAPATLAYVRTSGETPFGRWRIPRSR